MLAPSLKSIGLSVGFNASRCARTAPLFDEGRNVDQVSERLSPADPRFRLGTYVPMVEARMGGVACIDAQVGGSSAGPAMRTAANPAAAELEKVT